MTACTAPATNTSHDSQTMRNGPTVAIVQARNSSTRLPGKVLANLGGRPMLHHVIERCRAVPGVDVVCCATVEGIEGDGIQAAAESVGAVVFRGELDDVLGRYYAAARMLDASVVVRVTSDCPLIDPEVCGEVLALQREAEADLACNNLCGTWPYGLDCEVFSYSWLARAAAEATAPEEREHVTPYIRLHPEAKVVDLAGPGRNGHYFAVDRPDDLAFVSAIVAQLPDGPAGWSYRTVLSILEADPTLARLRAPKE